MRSEQKKEYDRKYSKEYSKNKREHNKEYSKAYREEHKEEQRNYKVLYYKAHPDTRKKYKHTRKAINKGVPHTLTPENWDKIKMHFNNTCCYCGKKSNLTQDHFIALSLQGEYSHNNIVPACRSCNATKHDKDFFLWYPQFQHYSIARERKILEFLHYNNGTQQLSFTM